MKLTAPITDLYDVERRVAVEIMGLPDVPWGPDSKCPYGHAMRFCIQRAWCCDCERWYYHPYKDYRDDLNDAMEAVEKMRERRMCITIMNQFGNDPRWFASFDFKDGQKIREASATDDSLPTAICRAALAAIEGTNGEAH